MATNDDLLTCVKTTGILWINCLEFHKTGLWLRYLFASIPRLPRVNFRLRAANLCCFVSRFGSKIQGLGRNKTATNSFNQSFFKLSDRTRIPKSSKYMILSLFLMIIFGLVFFEFNVDYSGSYGIQSQLGPEFYDRFPLQNKTKNDLELKLKLLLNSTIPTLPPVPTTARIVRTALDPAYRLSDWPIYTKFDAQDVTAETSKPDPELLFTLLDDIEALNPPIMKYAKDPNPDVMKIPKIIHQSWRTPNIPNVAKDWVKKWNTLNPDYTYIFWTNSKAYQFVERYYPWLRKYYDSYRIPVAKIDFFRYIALFAFGGFWADMDMEPLKSIEPVRSWSGCILGKHPDIQTYLIDTNNFMNVYATNYTATMNAFFAARPRHPFLFYLISRVVFNSPLYGGDHKTCNLMHNVVGCSGPSVMALAYGFYLRSIEKHRKGHPEYDVIVPDPDYFFPTYDLTYAEHLPRIRKRCEKPEDDYRKMLCERFKNQPDINKPKPQSFTVHNWAHTYMAFFEKDMEHTTPLKDILKYHTFDGSFEKWSPPFEQFGRD